MAIGGRRGLGLVLVLGALQRFAWAGTTCAFLPDADPIEKELGDLRLKFVGVEPTIVRKKVVGTPKIVITKYTHVPSAEVVDGALVVTSGSCSSPASTPAPTADTAGTETSAAIRGISHALFPAVIATTLTAKHIPALSLVAGALFATPAQASGHASCDAAMEVEVHALTMADVDSFVSQQEKTGQFRVCPPETVYHEFHSDVYGGYKGCVGDAGMIPCAQDGFGGMAAQQSLTKPYEFDAATSTCSDTGRTLADEILWILWGLPMDTHELLNRTGMNPVVHLPLARGSYPSHGWGGDHGDEGLDAKAVDDDWLEYLGAFTKSELATYKTTLTEGTEQGMVLSYAAMMVHIAKTTCNRDIHLLVQAPTYGYNYAAAVQLANNQASAFLNHSSCSCFADDSCKRPTLTMQRHGWFPGQPLPRAVGDDGAEYDASSSSDASPWFERMVWPENPTGETRTAQGPSNRLVCDGCYVYPMYFPDATVPSEKKPSCATWAFSLTKIYSAGVRAGTVLTLKDHPISAAMDVVAGEAHSIHNGIYSEWTWQGMNQIKKMLMAKPYTEPTSWIGAYTGLMREKWEIIADGFRDCPVVELTNGPLTGAYGWFKKKKAYRGLNSGWMDSFFLLSLGVETTSYNFGFRGATASDYYGEGYGNDDFTRLQLYRDISVYREVARRAKIVCGGGAVEHAGGTFLTADEWKDSMQAEGRRLAKAGAHPATAEDRARHLQEALPRLTGTEARILSERQHEAHKIQENIDRHCAPIGYPMSCLFKYTGYAKKDTKIRL
mmetsp:Transcript_83514/g.233024  ORF Transcript_83514/g.233024 Transcript_83514/m.233024 type:complete len:780 (+) Transcript_83514:59-2398(+)